MIQEKQYATRKDIRRRVDYDPTPSAHKITGPISPDELEELKRRVLDRRPTSLLLYQLGDITPPCGDGKPLSATLTWISQKCSRLMWEFNSIRLHHSMPFEVPNTRGQTEAAAWIVERCKRCTSSSAGRVLGLSGDKAQVHFLRQHVWGLDRFQSEAMAYGQQMEPVARNAYMADTHATDPTYEMIETGLWVNPKYPTLACSPDGLLHHPINGTILIEVKVITDPAVDPRIFDTDLSGKKLTAFYLRRDPEDRERYLLKPTHRYYHQVQMSLDILELDWCHLVVWSERGQVVAAVQRDASFWNEKRLRLIKYQREVILPELLLQRTKRHFPPIRITYPPFHEDERDPFFSTTQDYDV